MINIRSIWENQKSSEQTILVKTKIDKITNVNCYAATNQITNQHLFILSVSLNIIIPDLRKYRFKGTEIFMIEVENHIELNIYLLDNDLKDIFSLFIENVIDELENCQTEVEAVTKTINVFSKWKKLFENIPNQCLTLEEQKGLIGELLFLNSLLDNTKTSEIAIDSWTSTEKDFEAKDFTIGSTGIEIKFTSAKHPKIQISNEKQLDSDNLNFLFIVLFQADAVKENGISLNSIIEHTRTKIKSSVLLDSFNRKLKINNYFENDCENYQTMFSINNIFHFHVSENFPKITKKQIPLGIFETTYSIEISAVEPYLTDLDFIINNS